MLLARAGADVTVIEKQPRVGGRTATLNAGGFQFDLGPDFFSLSAYFDEIYAASGYNLAPNTMVKLISSTGWFSERAVSFWRLRTSRAWRLQLRSYVRMTRQTFDPSLMRIAKSWSDSGRASESPFFQLARFVYRANDEVDAAPSAVAFS